MISKEELVKSLLYFFFMVLSEILLNLSTSYFMASNEYTMPAMIFVFILIAWLLRMGLANLGVVALLSVIYGCISYYSQYTIYAQEYPSSLIDFLPAILAKTLIYTFPLALLSVFPRKRS